MVQILLGLFLHPGVGWISPALGRTPDPTGMCVIETNQIVQYLNKCKGKYIEVLAHFA
jgi:hypothetical protein